MQYLGPIDGMNFNPISDYNQKLKGSAAFEVGSDFDFEKVLNKQQEKIHGKTPVMRGGLEVNMNLDDFAPARSARNAGSAGSLLASFGSSISGGLNSVNNANVAADKAQEALAMGEDVSVHDVMIAAEKASLSLQMATQLRNKLLGAYTEINNVKV